MRYQLEANLISYDEVQELYQTWVNQDEGFVLQLQYGPEHNFQKKTIAVKCAKRGNDVYRYRVNNRLKLLSDALDNVGITINLCRDKDNKIDPSRSRSNTIFATFTTWTVLQSREYAWANPERAVCPYKKHKGKCMCWTKSISPSQRFLISRSISIRWNKFMARLRKKFGRVEVVRSFESTEKGYPHIHAELIFKDLTEDELFHVFEHVDKKTGEKSLRIEEQEDIKKLWDDRVVDIRVPWNVNQAKDYVMKEIFKNGFSAKLGTKTLSMLWVFRKRAFSISRGINQIMSRLDNGMHNSNQKTKALDLFGLPIDDLHGAKWVFVGVFSWNKILDLIKPNQKEGLWSYELSGIPK